MPTLFFDNNIPVGYCFMQDPSMDLPKKFLKTSILNTGQKMLFSNLHEFVIENY